MHEGQQITTIEGLERDGHLHPVQEAFIEHDGFQCGFCTSGQIMSAIAMIEEARAGWPSAETDMSNFTKTDAGRDLALGMQALKRIGKPDDVADVIVFLASDGPGGSPARAFRWTGDQNSESDQTSLSLTSMLPRVALPYCRDFSHPNRTPRIAIFRRVRSEAQPLGQVSNP